ncbi:MAG: hypothetical protein K8R89_01095 [Anaerolineae bacterium]|nr:hypothetical protein [Anaerolineae bacterium]
MKKVRRALSLLAILICSCLGAVMLVLIALDQGWIGIEYLDTPIYERIMCDLPLPNDVTYENCGKPYAGPSLFYWKSYYTSNLDRQILEDFYCTEMPNFGWSFVAKEPSGWDWDVLLFTGRQQHWLTEHQYWLGVLIPSANSECDDCYIELGMSEDENALRQFFILQRLE